MPVMRPDSMPDSPRTAFWAAGAALLRAKADALLSAGHAQITERRAWRFVPQADPESAACFSPVG